MLTNSPVSLINFFAFFLFNINNIFVLYMFIYDNIMSFCGICYA